MDLYEIVMNLAGPITPTGDHGVDQRRLANLGNITGLVDTLVVDLVHVSDSANRQEASVKKIGEHARDFLSQLSECLTEVGHVEYVMYSDGLRPKPGPHTIACLRCLRPMLINEDHEKRCPYCERELGNETQAEGTPE
jgi:hypothetical protein